MSYVLKNNRLKVEFATPEQDYNGTRFDRMGMIKGVTLDSKDKFHSKESLVEGQGSGGQGFYNEFGIEEPIGYSDAIVGDQFPKIGVGLLTKDSDKEYDFFHTYPIEPFEVNVEEDENSITFISNHCNTRGYSVKYSKKISIKENEMIIDYKLENTGEKIIDTTEYCHNFTAINNNSIGEDYSLKFSYPVEIDVKVGEFEVNGREIKWNDTVKEVFYCRLKNFCKEENQYFEIVHKPSGIGFRETSKFKLERVAVWGMPYVVSPEAFIRIKIAPGESECWTRIYKFFN